ncbi:MAG: hypothetical protein ACK559_06230, partial [bacterium]
MRCRTVAATPRTGFSAASWGETKARGAASPGSSMYPRARYQASSAATQYSPPGGSGSGYRAVTEPWDRSCRHAPSGPRTGRTRRKPRSAIHAPLLKRHASLVMSSSRRNRAPQPLASAASAGSARCRRPTSCASPSLG